MVVKCGQAGSVGCPGHRWVFEGSVVNYLALILKWLLNVAKQEAWDVLVTDGNGWVVCALSSYWVSKLQPVGACASVRCQAIGCRSFSLLKGYVRARGVPWSEVGWFERWIY